MTVAHRRPLVMALVLGTLAAACASATTSPAVSSPAASDSASAIAAHAVPGGATAPVDDATWALADRITASSYTADNTDAFRAALAAAGIAVVADTSTDPASAAPEVPVTGSPSPLELLDFQAHSLAVQAWGEAGWTGAELDGVAPLPSAAPSGTPSMAQLLAAYSASAATPGGAFARALLAGQNLKDPATVRFPAVVLLLFASDLATDGGRLPAPSAAPSSGARLLPLAAAAPVVAVPAVDVGLLCSGPSGWIDAVVQNLEAALINAMPPGIVGTVLGAALSWFIHIAAGLVKGLVDTFLAPVLTVIRGIAAIASGLAEQIASVMPFSVQVIAGHGEVAQGATFFLGSDSQRGQYTAYVSAGDLPNWPDAVAKCAAAAGIALPDFTSKGVPITFGPLEAPGDPLLGPTDQALTTTATDDTGRAIWPFLTARDPGDSTGEQRNQFDYMPVAVHRPELDTLKNRLTLTLLSPLPAILQPFVGAILAPVLDGIQDRLNSILDVRGSGPAIIVYHDKASASASASASSLGSCSVDVGLGAYSGTFDAHVDTTQSGTQDHYVETGPVSLSVAQGGIINGTFSLHITRTYDLDAGGIHDHLESSDDLRDGQLTGSACDLITSGGELASGPCHDSLFGDCTSTSDFGSLLRASHLGPATVDGNQLSWRFSRSVADAGLTESWSVVVSNP